MVDKYILLDCSSVLHPLLHSIGIGGDQDQIIFGFFNKVLMLSSKFNSKDFVFCWDDNSRKKSRRKLFFSEYKANRNKDLTKEEQDHRFECYKTFDKIRSMVEEIGFRNSYSMDQLEADDILATICKQEEYHSSNIVVCTSDGDLLQLLEYPNVLYYSISKNKRTTKNMFLEEYNIEPSLFWKVKAMAGDTSDNVDGVNGVGLKTAIKFINGELKETSKKYQSIINYPMELRKRNRILMKLPFPQTNPVTLVDETDISMERFVKYCYERGMDGFLNETFEKWEEFFSGRHFGSNDDRRKRAEERRGKK